MSIIRTLSLDCHARSGANAELTVIIDQTEHNFTLVPTIDWISSSSSDGAHKITLELKSSKNTCNVQIRSQGNDVLICGYHLTNGDFKISSQPIWNVENWRPYDISGHQGDDAEYQGNGSLQILDGQTVEFVAQLVSY
jgi:hypothetical protein